MSENFATNRRLFLKVGAIVAAPFVPAASVAAMAAEDGSARLARVEDERAIEVLHRKLLRHLNGANDGGLASSGIIDVGQGLRAIAENSGHEAELVLAKDGLSATMRCACSVEWATELTGASTIEQMTRFQGHGSHSHREERVLATEFRKAEEGWRIAGATLA